MPKREWTAQDQAYQEQRALQPQVAASPWELMGAQAAAQGQVQGILSPYGPVNENQPVDLRYVQRMAEPVKHKPYQVQDDPAMGTPEIGNVWDNTASNLSGKGPVFRR